jgi:hypothetical protein
MASSPRRRPPIPAGDQLRAIHLAFSSPARLLAALSDVPDDAAAVAAVAAEFGFGEQEAEAVLDQQLWGFSRARLASIDVDAESRRHESGPGDA